MWWLLVILTRVNSAEWWGWKLKCNGFKHERGWRRENIEAENLGHSQLTGDVESRKVLLGFFLFFILMEAIKAHLCADRNNTLKRENWWCKRERNNCRSKVPGSMRENKEAHTRVKEKRRSTSISMGGKAGMWAKLQADWQI